MTRHWWSWLVVALALVIAIVAIFAAPHSATLVVATLGIALAAVALVARRR